MKILYIDIDTLRPDHLGCYGYHRNTSPNIDKIAAQGLRFNNCYATDVPCLPSRSSLFSGRFGIHNGSIGHGGTAADPFVEGYDRSFKTKHALTCWMQLLRYAGHYTASVSPFAERHSAFHFYAGFNEMINPGRSGQELADEISEPAIDWLDRNQDRDNWFLHVHMWDPHTPYRAPKDFGDPFKDDPLPEWYSEEIRQKHWQGVGPHSAQEIPGHTSECAFTARHPRQPNKADSMETVRAMFDGYDTGVLYADKHIGLILDKLEQQGILDETVIMVSADHGENLGELNIYGDHQTADEITTNIPLIVRWPGITDKRAGQGDDSLIYHFDFAATMAEILGQKIPDNWDGRSFADDFKSNKETDLNDYLVVSQACWSCQRAVRFRDNGNDYIAIRTYHDGHHGYPDLMLFDLTNDPHEQNDLAQSNPELAAKAMAMLDEWHKDMMRTATHPIDPMWTVMREGGPFHTRGQMPAYLERLKATGRPDMAELLAKKHPDEV